MLILKDYDYSDGNNDCDDDDSNGGFDDSSADHYVNEDYGVKGHDGTTMNIKQPFFRATTFPSTSDYLINEDPGR